MHTPEGFTPRHVLPNALPAGTLAFAFRDARLLVGGTGEAPVIPDSSTLHQLGIAGPAHFLGDLDATACVALTLRRDDVDTGERAHLHGA